MDRLNTTMFGSSAACNSPVSRSLELSYKLYNHFLKKYRHFHDKVQLLRELHVRETTEIANIFKREETLRQAYEKYRTGFDCIHKYKPFNIPVLRKSYAAGDLSGEQSWEREMTALSACIAGQRFRVFSEYGLDLLSFVANIDMTVNAMKAVKFERALDFITVFQKFPAMPSIVSHLLDRIIKNAFNLTIEETKRERDLSLPLKKAFKLEKDLTSLDQLDQLMAAWDPESTNGSEMSDFSKLSNAFSELVKAYQTLNYVTTMMSVSDLLQNKCMRSGIKNFAKGLVNVQSILFNDDINLYLQQYEDTMKDCRIESFDSPLYVWDLYESKTKKLFSVLKQKLEDKPEDRVWHGKFSNGNAAEVQAALLITDKVLRKKAYQLMDFEKGKKIHEYFEYVKLDLHKTDSSKKNSDTLQVPSKKLNQPDKKTINQENISVSKCMSFKLPSKGGKTVNETLQIAASFHPIAYEGAISSIESKFHNLKFNSDSKKISESKKTLLETKIEDKTNSFHSSHNDNRKMIDVNSTPIELDKLIQISTHEVSPDMPSKYIKPQLNSEPKEILKSKINPVVRKIEEKNYQFHPLQTSNRRSTDAFTIPVISSKLIEKAMADMRAKLLLKPKSNNNSKDISTSEENPIERKTLETNNQFDLSRESNKQNFVEQSAQKSLNHTKHLLEVIDSNFVEFEKTVLKDNLSTLLERESKSIIQSSNDDKIIHPASENETTGRAATFNNQTELKIYDTTKLFKLYEVIQTDIKRLFDASSFNVKQFLNMTSEFRCSASKFQSADSLLTPKSIILIALTLLLKGKPIDHYQPINSFILSELSCESKNGDFEKIPKGEQNPVVPEAKDESNQILSSSKINFFGGSWKDPKIVDANFGQVLKEPVIIYINSPQVLKELNKDSMKNVDILSEYEIPEGERKILQQNLKLSDENFSVIYENILELKMFNDMLVALEKTWCKNYLLSILDPRNEWRKTIQPPNDENSSPEMQKIVIPPFPNGFKYSHSEFLNLFDDIKSRIELIYEGTFSDVEQLIGLCKVRSKSVFPLTKISSISEVFTVLIAQVTVKLNSTVKTSVPESAVDYFLEEPIKAKIPECSTERKYSEKETNEPEFIHDYFDDEGKQLETKSITCPSSDNTSLVRDAGSINNYDSKQNINNFNCIDGHQTLSDETSDEDSFVKVNLSDIESA